MLFVFDAPTAPTEVLHPDPTDRAVPPCVGKVLGLVRTFIAYGRNLTDSLRQHAADPNVLPYFAFVARIFATTDVAQILARISRGLLRAAALEERLRRRAARGQELKPTPIRLPRTSRPAVAKPPTQPDHSAENPSLASPSTLEQILAHDRRRPIGAVLVDICLDLGIVPGQMDRATREELRLALNLYGYASSLTKFLADPAGGTPRLRGGPMSTCIFGPIPIAGWPAIAYPAWPVPFPQSPSPACTGPP